MLNPRLDILPAAQRILWAELGQTPNRFVLYGGTAMALRLGHRQSLDFDFFSNDSFEPGSLYSNIPYLAHARIDQRGDNTLSATVDRNGPVRVSYLGDVRMRSVKTPDLASDNGLQIASLLDLAATKLKTIQQRAEVKDYLDIAAALAEGISLSDSLGSAIAIYGKTFNPLAALKALSYFEDGTLPTLPQGIRQQLRKSAQQVDLISLPRMPVRPDITHESMQS